MAMKRTLSGYVIPTAEKLAAEVEQQEGKVAEEDDGESVLDDAPLPAFVATDEATAVTGYANIAIDPAEAFLSPATAATLVPSYNFQYTPPARTSFAFNSSGWYFADFTIYPKTGAVISFRVPVKVE